MIRIKDLNIGTFFVLVEKDDIAGIYQLIRQDEDGFFQLKYHNPSDIQFKSSIAVSSDFGEREVYLLCNQGSYNSSKCIKG